MAVQRKHKTRKTLGKKKSRGAPRRLRTGSKNKRPARPKSASRGSKSSKKGQAAKGKAKQVAAKKAKAAARIKVQKLAKAKLAKAKLAKAKLAKAKLAKAKKAAKQKSDRLKAAQKREKARRAAAKASDRARAEKARKRAREQKERERATALKKRQQKQREAEKARDRARADRERKEAILQKKRQAQQEAQKKAKERATLQKKREQEKRSAEKVKEREAARLEKEKAAQKKLAEKAKERQAKEREAQKALEKKQREADKIRKKAEREAERARLKAERDAERERIREEARQKKEAERAKRDAEREAYRKAKEAEQARLRAEREAARRALEGRVVRATRASRAAASGRSIAARVYTPASIPDQSGTRRTAGEEGEENRFANLRIPKVAPRAEGDVGKPIPRTIPPPPPPPPPATIEERFAKINERLALTEDAFRNEYQESLLMSWIYHDSALEGVVYTYEELRLAINPTVPVVPDSSLQTVCDEIRRHKAAIEFVRDQAEKKRSPVNIDTVKRIYLILHPEEGDLKTVKYRKDIPQHRLYFHEYAAPDKIAYKVRQVFDWMNGPEPKKIKNAVRIAARVHYDLLRVFPFALDSGKVARLFMNLLLMRADCPPALIHSTERQRYYEALRGQLPVIVNMVTESIVNALSSIEKKLDERDSKLRTFA